MFFRSYETAAQKTTILRVREVTLLLLSCFLVENGRCAEGGEPVLGPKGATGHLEWTGCQLCRERIQIQLALRIRRYGIQRSVCHPDKASKVSLTFSHRVNVTAYLTRREHRCSLKWERKKQRTRREVKRGKGGNSWFAGRSWRSKNELKPMCIMIALWRN